MSLVHSLAELDSPFRCHDWALARTRAEYTHPQHPESFAYASETMALTGLSETCDRGTLPAVGILGPDALAFTLVVLAQERADVMSRMAGGQDPLMMSR